MTQVELVDIEGCDGDTKENAKGRGDGDDV